jgi:hypothetical protein
VRRGTRWASLAIVLEILLAILGHTRRASAQMPVCGHPDPAVPVYGACIPRGRFAVVPFLTSLSVDQLLKGDGGAVTRSPHVVFETVASEELAEANPSLHDYLRRLDAIQFNRLDTATGTVRLDVDESERRFSGDVTIADVRHELTVDLPSRVEAGYWRTPGVLQLAFWKDQRPSFRVSSMSAEIECLVIAGDGIRIVTSGNDAPDVLVRFDGCE